MEPLTPQAMCAWRDEAQRRLDAGMEQAAPPLAALIITLTPEQLRHMERKLAKTGAELRADYAQADRAERARNRSSARWSSTRICTANSTNPSARAWRSCSPRRPSMPTAGWPNATAATPT